MRTETAIDKVMVIDGEAGMTIQGLRLPAFGPMWNLAGLFTLAAFHDLSQIWITASALKELDQPRAGFLEHGPMSVPKGQSTFSSWLSIWDTDHFLEVSIPSLDPGSPFKSLDFGPALLGELLEFTDATGMLWKRSGAITSDAWLRDHFRKNGLLKATEYPEIAADGNLEPDLHYMRAPEGKELRASRLVAFDANAMYLGAMSSLALPVGEVSHISGAARGVPGYWRSHENLDHWVTTPTALYQAEWFSEGYYWEESHRFLEPLYKLLREGRTKLLHRPDSAALEALKQVYRQGIGRFGSTRRSDPDDILYQPYWRHAVQAEARCRLLRRIDSLAVKPIAVDVDCLYLLTSWRGDFSPEFFGETIGLPVDDQIGHFKFAGEMSGKSARGILSGSLTITHGTRRLESLAALREGIRP